MKLPRRNFLHLAAGAAALPAVSRIAWAQTYPTRPVRIIVGFPAGLGPDITARLIAQLLSERFGKSFIVDNRPGAGSNIGTEIVVRAPADGYTLLLMTASNAINATVYDNLNFDFIRAVAPVASVGVVPFLMVVNPSFPAQTISEFIAYAKAHPAKINMGSAGYGSAPHIFGELFKMMTGIDSGSYSVSRQLLAGFARRTNTNLVRSGDFGDWAVARACGHHANASRGNADYPCARRICAGL